MGLVDVDAGGVLDPVEVGGDPGKDVGLPTLAPLVGHIVGHPDLDVLGAWAGGLLAAHLQVEGPAAVAVADAGPVGGVDADHVVLDGPHGVESFLAVGVGDDGAVVGVVDGVGGAGGGVRGLPPAGDGGKVAVKLVVLHVPCRQAREGYNLCKNEKK